MQETCSNLRDPEGTGNIRDCAAAKCGVTRCGSSCHPTGAGQATCSKQSCWEVGFTTSTPRREKAQAAGDFSVRISWHELQAKYGSHRNGHIMLFSWDRNRHAAIKIESKPNRTTGPCQKAELLIRHQTLEAQSGPEHPETLVNRTTAPDGCFRVLTDSASDWKRVDAREQVVACLARRKSPATAHLQVTLATNAKKKHSIFGKPLECLSFESSV